MKIIPMAGRPLTEAELAGIHRFRSYTDGIPFACLHERVMLMLDSPSTDPEVLREQARKQMREALSTQADFEVHEMFDGYRLAVLPSGVCAFSKGKAGADFALFLRSLCLAACQARQVLAVVHEE